MESDSSSSDPLSAPNSSSKDRRASDVGDRRRHAKKCVKRSRSPPERPAQHPQHQHDEVDHRTIRRRSLRRSDERRRRRTDSDASSSSSSLSNRDRDRHTDAKEKKQKKRRKENKDVRVRTKDRHKAKHKVKEAKRCSDRRHRDERRKGGKFSDSHLEDSGERTRGSAIALTQSSETRAERPGNSVDAPSENASPRGVVGEENRATAARGEGFRSDRGPTLPVAAPTPADAVSARQRGPMTWEQYEAERAVVRRVVDPDTGRVRLARGTGEIIEQIVSRDDHHRINRIATQGDGASYATQVGRAAAEARQSRGFLYDF